MTNDELVKSLAKDLGALMHVVDKNPGLTFNQICMSFKDSDDKKYWIKSMLYQCLYFKVIEERGWFVKRYYYLSEN